jgi:Leucine-rich repeat (LRR) protein
MDIADNESKLTELILDLRNWDQNSLFISLFSVEETNALWKRTYPIVSDEDKNLFGDKIEMIQLALLSFGVEGSIPADIRTGLHTCELRFFFDQNTLILPESLSACPQGVLYQIIQALSIQKLEIVHAELLKALFPFDFQMCSEQIKGISIRNINSDFQLTVSLYKSVFLEELIFENVKGAILPEDLSAMHGLKKLEISYCTLKAQPTFDLQYQNLETFKLETIPLEKFDFQLLPKRNLSTLSMINGKLRVVTGILELTNLRELDLSHQRIEEIDLSALSQLSIFYARNNSLTALPKFGAAGNSLKEIDLSENKLTQLDFDAPLNVIETINVSNNRIEHLPQELHFFSSLHHLDLSANLVQTFPEDLLELANLSYLNLEDNRIQKVQLQVNDFSDSRTQLFLRGNQIENDDKRMLMNNRMYIRSL